MSNNWNLSEKEIEACLNDSSEGKYRRSDVKEFIQQLINSARCTGCGITNEEESKFPITHPKAVACCPECFHKISIGDLKKLAGEKLI